ncbi:MAG TPA: hypothetical protein VIV60_22675 [Polyangiaceae bacterium]
MSAAAGLLAGGGSVRGDAVLERVGAVTGVPASGVIIRGGAALERLDAVAGLLAGGGSVRGGGVFARFGAVTGLLAGGGSVRGGGALARVTAVVTPREEGGGGRCDGRFTPASLWFESSLSRRSSVVWDAKVSGLFAEEAGSRGDTAKRLLAVATPGVSLAFGSRGAFGTELSTALPSASVLEFLAIEGDGEAALDSSVPPQSSSISSVGGLND